MGRMFDTMNDATTYGAMQQASPQSRMAKAFASAPEEMKAATPINYEAGLNLATNIPVAGDVLSGVLALRDAARGEWGSAAANAIGVLPFVPSGVGMIKTRVGRIPETAADTGSLADMLVRAGERAGYSVKRSDSAISPSRYVTFTKAGDETGETARQVRISNHADKYPELADGVRTSVDPSTEVSFEQAVNWLGREGFPTTLSARYRNVPTWEQYYAAERAAAELPEVRLQKMIDAWRNRPKAERGPMPTLDSLK